MNLEYVVARFHSLQHLHNNAFRLALRTLRIPNEDRFESIIGKSRGQLVGVFSALLRYTFAGRNVLRLIEMKVESSNGGMGSGEESYFLASCRS